MDRRKLTTTFLDIAKEIKDSTSKTDDEISHKLSQLCKNLKIQGPRLDKEYKQEMDKVQVELVRLCQMQQVDLAVRLQMLELIELRSLGWKANQEIEEYYKNHFDTIARGKIPTSSFDEEMASHDSVRLDGDGARSNSSGQPSSSVNVYEEELLIGAYKLTLKCPDRIVLQLSKQQLENLFKSRNELSISTPETVSSRRTAARVKINLRPGERPPPALQYSREQILNIANNPQSKEQPVQWNEMVRKLPDLVLKKNSARVGRVGKERSHF